MIKDRSFITMLYRVKTTMSANMKVLTISTLLLISVGLSACSSMQVAQPQAPILSVTPSEYKGESIHPVVTENQLRGYLVTSEATGLHWLNQNGEAVSHWQSHSNQADWRESARQENTIVISAINSNSSAIEVLTLNLLNGEFLQRLTLPSTIAERDTLCMTAHQDDLYVYSSDARGLLSHYVIEQSATSPWQLHPIRELMVGPNLSDCAVDDNHNRLYLTEENIGVWQYNSNSEGENTRQLHYIPLAPETESISATPSGLFFTVATDEAVIRQGGLRSSIISVDKTRELKSINVAQDTDVLYVGLYDEGADQLLYGTLGKSTPLPVTPLPPANIIADGQTEPVARYGDAADDPAIWVNTAAPAKSLILGTDKKFGLNVYGLSGALLQSLPVGRVNNVDIRQQVKTPLGAKDIAVASNRSSQSLTFFDIDENGHVSHSLDLPTTMTDIYGLCTGIINGELTVFVNDTNGDYQQYSVSFQNKTPQIQLVRQFRLPSQPEGCVVDDQTQQLYMGEEARGIWQLDLAVPHAEPRLIAQVNKEVNADIEGMGIYPLDGKRYLIVSSQGNNRFAVYALDDNNRLVGTFSIGLNSALMIDGVSETDGLEVTSANLGQAYPMGLLVVQDGRNVLPHAPQNFKLVSGQKLADFINHPINHQQ